MQQGEKDMTSGRPRTRIQIKNRAAILDAGLDAFSAHGFRGATLDQIAETAGMSKPNLLYYFGGKDAIYTALLERLLDTWLDPLREIDPDGDPVAEILGYAQRKLDLSRDYPRESRLFANEVLQGAPHIHSHLSGDLKTMVDDVAVVIARWAGERRIKPVDPRHLIFSIWSLTQHYADFEVQVTAVLGHATYFDDAATHLDRMLRGVLEP
jgi:TetR/AcrR family transcriptional regulator